MTDRELLELAAKAAGLDANLELNGTYSLWNEEIDCIQSVWNPLTDDGDALRLAVNVGLKVCIDLDEGATRILNVFDGLICMHMHFDKDALQATRRAIVRASAEIGKGMK